MAERRMFSKTIIDSDAFLDMPLSTQALYFHLSMRGDDDGFINNPKKIQRMIGASDDDLKVLIAKKFIIPFETGIVVIKHWKIHNYIRNDRYHETKYLDEKSRLMLKENGAYTVNTQSGIPTDNQVVYQRDTEVRLGKISIDKDSIDKDSIDKDSIDKESIGESKKIVRHKYGEYNNVLLSDEDFEKLKNEFPNDYQARIENLSSYIASTGKSYKNHLATIRNWAKREKEKVTVVNRPINSAAQELDEAYKMMEDWANKPATNFGYMTADWEDKED